MFFYSFGILSWAKNIECTLYESEEWKKQHRIRIHHFHGASAERNIGISKLMFVHKLHTYHDMKKIFSSSSFDWPIAMRFKMCYRIAIIDGHPFLLQVCWLSFFFFAPLFFARSCLNAHLSIGTCVCMFSIPCVNYGWWFVFFFSFPACSCNSFNY